MTRKKAGVLTAEQALRLLFSDGPHDLTPEGYQEALVRLRKTDATEARRVERSLEPYLKTHIFPARKRDWHETSMGTKARLYLLPDNPHLHADVAAIRTVLRIPDGHVRTTEPDRLRLRDELGLRVKPSALRRVVEGHLAGSWLDIHRRARTIGHAPEEAGPSLLSSEMRQSAMSSAGVDMMRGDVPGWLRHPPTGPAPYNKPCAPIDWAAGCLVARHRLPWSATSPLVFFVLTHDSDWLRGLEHIEVEISADDDSLSGPGAFSLKVKGIDEFMTKDDWERLWTAYVQPRQETRWRQRGAAPQGRRTADLARLRKWMPLYRQMVEDNLRPAEALKDGMVGDVEDDVDQETVRRAVSDLRVLLRPDARQ